MRSGFLDIGQVRFCVFMDRDKARVHKHVTIERGQYPAILTKQACSKKIYFMEKSTVFLLDTVGNPERATDNQLPLARSGSQSQRRILSILPG